jgi:hypothetical protein
MIHHSIYCSYVLRYLTFLPLHNWGYGSYVVSTTLLGAPAEPATGRTDDHFLEPATGRTDDHFLEESITRVRPPQRVLLT